MKRRWTSLLAVLAIVLGTGLAVYPFVSQWLYQNQVQYVQGEVSTSQLEEEWQEAVAYNRLLHQGSERVTDPFATEQQSEPESYEQQLNPLGDGQMGILEIPKLELSLPIFHGTEEAVLQEGVGHLKASSLPTGGESTHCVLSAHAGLPGKRLFSDLEQMEIGDLFYLKVLDRTLCYRVDQILVVEPQELDALYIQDGEDLVTLMTCTPYGINSHRLLVRGQRTEETVETAGTEQTHSRWLLEYRMVLLGFVALGGAAAIAGVVSHRRRRRKDLSER